jgi:hypothetical protein
MQRLETLFRSQVRTGFGSVHRRAKFGTLGRPPRRISPKSGAGSGHNRPVICSEADA